MPCSTMFCIVTLRLSNKVQRGSHIPWAGTNASQKDTVMSCQARRRSTPLLFSKATKRDLNKGHDEMGMLARTLADGRRNLLGTVS
jgi:hypothetical protein